MVKTTAILLAGGIVAALWNTPAQAELIEPPTTEAVIEALGSDDEQVVYRALTDVYLYRLPVMEHVRPLLGDDRFHPVATFLAAEADEAAAVAQMKAATDPDKRRKMAEVLLLFDSSREAASRALIELVMSPEYEAYYVFRGLDGKAAGQAMAFFLSALARGSGPPQNPTDLVDVAVFELAPLMRQAQWPGIKRLLTHANEELRFLAAQWLVLGDFDDVEERELSRVLDEPDPILQAAAATVLVRQDGNNASARARLLAALQSDNARARRVAILGAGTLAAAGDLVKQLLPSLLHDSPRVRWTASEVVVRLPLDRQNETVRFVDQHLAEFNDSTLYDVVSRFGDLPREAVPTELLIRLTKHRHKYLRSLAVRQLQDIPRSPAVVGAMLACLDDPTGHVRIVALNALGMAQLTDHERAMTVARALALTTDVDAGAESNRGVRVAAAALCWKLNADRPAIVELAKQWLSSDVREDVDNGIELLEHLEGSSAELLPLAFARATEHPMNHMRLRNSSQSFHREMVAFLLTKLASEDVQERGTALQLLPTSATSDDAVLAALTELLDDNATYKVPRWGKPRLMPIGQTAAVTLARFARNDRTTAARLRADPQILSKIRQLTPTLMTWIKTTQPTLEEICSGTASAGFWTVERLLKESTGAPEPKVPLTDRVTTELLLEYFELAEKLLPFRLGQFPPVPEFILYELKSAESMDPRLAVLLERWVAEVPLMAVDTRRAAATALLKHQPDNAVARRYLRMVDRTLPTEDFYQGSMFKPGNED